MGRIGGKWGIESEYPTQGSPRRQWMAPSHPGPEGAEAVLCPTAPQDGQEMTSSEKGTKRKRKVPHIPPSWEEGKAFLEGGYAGLPSTSAEFPGEFSVPETQGRAQWLPYSPENMSASDSGWCEGQTSLRSLTAVNTGLFHLPTPVPTGKEGTQTASWWQWSPSSTIGMPSPLHPFANPTSFLNLQI